MSEHKLSKKPAVPQWRSLPDVRRNVYDALAQLHEVSKQVVKDCPKDFDEFVQFALVKGIQTIDSWLSQKLDTLIAEEKAKSPTIEIVQPGELKAALQEGDLGEIIKRLKA